VLSGTATLTGSATTAIISIPIYGDARPEDDETIQIVLGSVVGATVFRGVGTVTILNDD
jgi:hypothetical protein